MRSRIPVAGQDPLQARVKCQRELATHMLRSAKRYRQYGPWTVPVQNDTLMTQQQLNQQTRVQQL